jgi:hypothetical protein
MLTIGVAMLGCKSTAARPADGSIQGVETFAGLTQNHSSDPVEYAQNPPVGGDHAPVWMNCGFYNQEIPSELAVHALEHGAVWITFSPNLPADQVQKLQQLAHANSYALVTQYSGLPSPVVASAWGRQLKLDSVNDPRLDQFVRAYAQGPTTPEPGAPCTGGVGTPER